ncbi:hypothetical protein SERLA73DRAFT_175992 [Serpula lacrymans var. lacrymans S7.3]|uniref:Integrase catalytic domain-containing protein n=1 Tax=Serpula lacrymans var. lacrymans (strain S7.3) TaxID=936435 RepID=F8PLU7_SERL3|nr:hypothetical protein SERLA73DRAFT_175992 [Serpula lacrymans var. lacrymans S7.3]
MLRSSGMPKYLWGEAVRHAVWLKNHTSMKALDNMTPHEAAHGTKPDLSLLHEWGCKALIHDASGSKLNSLVWEGWDWTTKARAITSIGQGSTQMFMDKIFGNNVLTPNISI